MGRPTLKEPSVLKLVHPGGLVEIHTTPITADEVMKKNPKHCVARPDVFKNPWIVVRPESVLKPGSIFYIVPHHTMRKLMLKAQEKDKVTANQSKENISVEITDKRNGGKSISRHGSSRVTQNGNKNSRVACDDQSALEYSPVDLSYFNSVKDMTPSHAADEKDIIFNSVNIGSYGSKYPVLSCSGVRHSGEQSTVRKERNQEAVTPNNRKIPRTDSEFQRKGYPVELPSKKITIQNDLHQLAASMSDKFKILEKPVNDQTEVQQESNKVDTLHISEKSQSATSLKSCLKTHKTINTMSDLRVRFMLPGDEEKIMRTRIWLSEISLETP